MRVAAVATGARPARELLSALCGRVLEAGDLGAAGAMELLAGALRRAGVEALHDCGEQPVRIEVVDASLGAQHAGELPRASCAWLLRAAPGARSLVEWRLDADRSGTLVAQAGAGPGRLLGIAGAPSAEGDIDPRVFAPGLLGAAVLAARAAQGAPRVRVYEGSFQLEGLPSDAPALVEVEVRGDGLPRGSIPAVAPARLPSIRQGDLTELSRLASGAGVVELGVAGFVLPFAAALDPELPAGAPVRPPAKAEDSSLRRAALASRWLLVAAAACLCGAYFSSSFKALARRGR